MEVVSSSHPLSRFFKWNNKIGFGNGIQFSSIEEIFTSIFLVQHGRTMDDFQIRQTVKDPIHFSDLLVRQLEGDNSRNMEAAILRRSGDIYLEIMRKLLQHGSNPFAGKMAELLASDNTINVFVVPSRTELVWSIGRGLPDIRRLRLSHLHNGRFPGANEYGRLLKLVYDECKTQVHPQPLFRFERSLIQREFPTERQSRLAAIVGDSQLHHLERAIGADFTSVSGGKYSDIVIELNDMCSSRGHKLIVLVVGFNVAKLDPDRWNQQFDPMKEFLKNVSNETTVIFNSVFPCLDRKLTDQVNEHADWVEHKIRKLNRSNITFLDWCTPHPDNPLIEEDGKIVNKYYEDKIHLSYTVFAKIWKRWCKVSDDLKFVNYRVSEKIYQPVRRPPPVDTPQVTFSVLPSTSDQH